MEGNSITSAHGSAASPHGDMNKMVIFTVSASAGVTAPYGRIVSLPGIPTKSYAVKTPAYGKTKGKHDLTHTSPCANQMHKVSMMSTLAFALAFLESTSQIIFSIEMPRPHNPRRQ